MTDLERAMNLLRQVYAQTMLTNILNNGVLLRTLPGSLYHEIGDFLDARDGWFEVKENGDPLWRLHRGDWGHEGLRIVATKHEDKRLWIKVGK
jgi:hypothetical protein